MLRARTEAEEQQRRKKMFLMLRGEDEGTKKSLAKTLPEFNHEKSVRLGGLKRGSAPALIEAEGEAKEQGEEERNASK